jgi:DNA-binding XRE family transcriptional regulator
MTHVSRKAQKRKEKELHLEELCLCYSIAVNIVNNGNFTTDNIYGPL